ncbi:unnamed protein product [Cylicocyclus nassatus]|uniref:Uncharacterized protein n=1 Tax=Cylicocyclus nassatus TaxID=53992 RepID=A0AA36H699_CYLNA|nr:unnamed protein product [Cylicocyclus nassatus]
MSIFKEDPTKDLLPIAFKFTFEYDVSVRFFLDCCLPLELKANWTQQKVVMDTSLGMTEEGIAQVLANLGTVFDPTTITQGSGHHSRIGLVTYGTNAEIRHKLTEFKSTDEFLERIWDIQRANDPLSNLKDGLMKAEQVFREGRADGSRDNCKEAIIIYASVYKESHFEDAKQLADQIKISGKDIIVVAFDQGGKPNALDQIRKIASDGFYFTNVIPNLSGEVQHALCAINCFCRKQWLQYTLDTIKYGSCLRIGGIDSNWNLAKQACIRIGHESGHLASVLDNAKHNFIAHMFKNDYRMESPYMYHIGLSYDTAQNGYFWEQPKGSEPAKIPMEGSDFRKWNKGFPSLNGDARCVLTAQTSTSFELGWQNIHCRNVSKRYICQMNSCDTDNYCANPNE